jgi:hypothetical protein
MQAGIVYTVEDRKALSLRVYFGLTQGEPSSPTLYNLLEDCLLEALPDATRLSRRIARRIPAKYWYAAPSCGQ